MMMRSTSAILPSGSAWDEKKKLNIDKFSEGRKQRERREECDIDINIIFSCIEYFFFFQQYKNSVTRILINHILNLSSEK